MPVQEGELVILGREVARSPVCRGHGRLSGCWKQGRRGGDLTDIGRRKEMAYLCCFLLLRDALFFRVGSRGRHRHAGRRRARVQDRPAEIARQRRSKLRRRFG